MNSVKEFALLPKRVMVKDAPENNIVVWGAKYYMRTTFQQNPARIAAVSLHDGGYLTPETMVEVVPNGTVLKITVGGEE